MVYHGSRSTEDFGVFDSIKSPHSRETGREEEYFFSNKDTAAVFASNAPQYEGEMPTFITTFRPDQIKSATENNGDVSEDNLDIRSGIFVGALYELHGCTYHASRLSQYLALIQNA